MLTDVEYKAAHKDQLPLLSPKDMTVWIIGRSFQQLLDEESEIIEPVDITLYIDERNIKRAMDTHTFKESFKEVFGCHIPNRTDEKNITAAKLMGYIK